jgi:hypothetical protein
VVCGMKDSPQEQENGAVTIKM